MAYVRLAGLHAFELDYEGCLGAARQAVEIAEAGGAEFERVCGAELSSALGCSTPASTSEGFEIMDVCYRQASAKGYWQIAQNVTWNDIWIADHMLQAGSRSGWSDSTSMPHTALVAGSQASCAQLRREGAWGPACALATTPSWSSSLYERYGYTKMVWRCRVQLAEVLVELGRDEEAQRGAAAASRRGPSCRTSSTTPRAQIRTQARQPELTDAIDAGAARSPSAATASARTGRPIAIAVEAFIAGGELDEARELAERARAGPGDTRRGVHRRGPGQGPGRRRRVRGGAVAPLRAAVAEAEATRAIRWSRFAPASSWRGRSAGPETREAATGELRAVVTEAADRDAGLIADEARGGRAARSGSSSRRSPRRPPTVAPGRRSCRPASASSPRCSPTCAATPTSPQPAPRPRSLSGSRRSTGSRSGPSSAAAGSSTSSPATR